MLKNIFLTMIMDKKAMKEVNAYKTSFFVAAFAVICAFEFMIEFLKIKLNGTVSLSVSSFIVRILTGEIVSIFLDFLFGYILYQVFLRKVQVKIPDLIFKTIISMNFIRPITSIIISFLLGNITKIGLLGVVILVYKFSFITAYIKLNLEQELPEKTLQRYISISLVIYFLVCILLIILMRFGLSAIGNIVWQ
ncbi:MAG: hypothetical protein J5631_04555 [Spirochaetaceae bacterium]|nr:hypothetical protein [Spirochaetaceae bacterium]